MMKGNTMTTTSSTIVRMEFQIWKPLGSLLKKMSCRKTAQQMVKYTNLAILSM